MRGRSPRHLSRCSAATIMVLPSAPLLVCTRLPPSPPSRLLAATPTSTAPPSPARRNKRWVALQFLVLVIVLGSITWTIRRQWRDFQRADFTGHPDWGYLSLSGLVVLATYALLVEVWRRILSEWHACISFGNAARIWCVSNLGKYVPGKVWQILAMGKMAEAVDVPPVAAAGSAILSTVVNIAMGCVVAVAAGWRALD